MIKISGSNHASIKNKYVIWDFIFLFIDALLICFAYYSDLVQGNHNHFLGYNKYDKGNLVIDPEQTEIVKRICREYLEDYTMGKILLKERYIGDALLLKRIYHQLSEQNSFMVELKSGHKIDIEV